MTAKFFSAEEISKAAQEAIDNWDFDQVDDGEKQILALKHLASNPPVEGVEIPAASFRDVWDWLAEYATNTAGDMSDEFAAYAKKNGW